MSTTNSQGSSSSDLAVAKQEDDQLTMNNEEVEKLKEDKIRCLQRENHLLRQHILAMQKDFCEPPNHKTHAPASEDALRSQIASLRNSLKRERRCRAAREGELRNEIERLRLALDEQLARVDPATPQMTSSFPLVRSPSKGRQTSPALIKQSTETALGDAMAKLPETRLDHSSLSSLKTDRASSNTVSYTRRIQVGISQDKTEDEDVQNDGGRLSPEKGLDAETDAQVEKDTFFDPTGPPQCPNGDIEQDSQNEVRKIDSSGRFEAPSSDVGDAYRVMCWTSSRRDERRRRLKQIADPRCSASLHEQTSAPSPYISPLLASNPTSVADEVEVADSVPRCFTLQEPNVNRRGVPLSPYGAGPLTSSLRPPPLPQPSHDRGTKESDQQNNPNQIGIEILDEKNRTWYTKQVLRMALLSAIPPEREDSRGAETGMEGGLCLQSKETVEESDQGAQPGPDSCNGEAPLRGESPGRGVSCFSLCSYSLSDSSLTSEDSDALFAVRKSTKPVMEELGRTACQGEKTGHGEGMPFENAPAGASVPPTAPPEAPLLYKDVNPQALQRAIEETLSFHFHCTGNAPAMTPGLRPPKNKKPLCAFAQDNNTDPNLLAAFSSSHRALGVEHFSDEMNFASSETSKYRDDEVCIHYHAPVIFNQIRSFLGLNTDALRSALKDSTWRQSISPGKSGTMLFFFGDFVMKTIRKYEFAFLCQRFLPAYVPYCERTPHTLLPRFFALMTMKWLKLGLTRRILLMQNVFTTRYYIHRLYDVKGSTVGRTALRPGKEPARTAYGALLLKDNDLPEQLILCGAYQRSILVSQLREDVNFLRSLNIVDYSCMIGVRGRFFLREEGPSRTAIKSCTNPALYVTTTSLTESMAAKVQPMREGANGDGKSAPGHPAAPRCANHPCEQKNGEVSHKDNSLCVCLHGCDGGLLSLPIGTSGDDTIMREEVYYIGLIDVLQAYNSTKKLENFAKGFVNDRAQLSAVPPKEYAERLCRTIERITV